MMIDDIKKVLALCVDSICDDCPYADTKDCYNQIKLDARDLIIKQESEIAQLKDGYARVQEQFAQYQKASDKEILAQVKQAKIEVLNKLKDYVNQLACDEYGDSACDTNYVTIDIDKYEQDIDEMIEELKNENQRR